MTRSPTPQALGELLVQRGLLAAEELEWALTQQRSSGDFLGTVLLREGLMQPEVLLEVLSEQCGIPCESITPERVDWRVARQFPTSILAENKCFPIRADAHTVTVAIASPLDVWAISAVEKVASSREVKPVLVLERELEAVCRAYKKQTLRSLGDRLTQYGDAETQ